MNTKLQPPCSYQGGKQRIAKQIVDIFFEQNEINDETVFYDLYCGSGAISIELVNRGVEPSNIVMIDKSPWGLFWQMIGDDTFSPEVFRYYIDDIPKDVSKIRSHVKEMSTKPANDGMFNNLVYKYLILQASSFGAKQIWVEDNKWQNTSFRSYWLPTETSSRRSPVNPMMPMPETLFERVENIAGRMIDVQGIHGDINDITYFEENSIIYIDPPYSGTTKYGYELDLESFIKKFDNKIYVSEGKQLTENAIQITGSRSKGGISGKRKSKNEEWLNIYN